MSEIPRNNTGLSGEYFVAAELYRRGWSVGMTIGNAKAVDLFAQKDEKIISIQVKSIFKKKNVGWPLMEDTIKDVDYYIFVNLNGDTMSNPEFFVCTPEETKDKVKQYKTRGIVRLGLLNSPEYKNNWNKLLIS